MTPKEKKKALRGATWSGACTKDGKKIMFASSREIEKREEYVRKVLKAFGHPEAWVSDMSSVGDFLCYLDTKKQQNARLREFAKLLGFKVKISDTIWEVAERLQKVEKDIIQEVAKRLRKVAKDGRKLPLSERGSKSKAKAGNRSKKRS